MSLMRGLFRKMHASEEIFREQLGSDLWRLVVRVSSSLEEITPLTCLPSRCSGRASFRLRFKSGQIIKGRRFETIVDAEMVERISPVLDRRYFPRILSRHRAAMLTEWVEGEALSSQNCGLNLMRECGALHGRLHTIAPPRGLVCKVADRRLQLVQYLNELTTSGALYNEERKQAVAL